MAWKISGSFAVNMVTGERYAINYDSVKGLTRGTKQNLEDAILYYLRNGRIPQDGTQGDNINRGKPAWRNISKGLDDFITTHNLTSVKDPNIPGKTNVEEEQGIHVDPQELQFNEYWRDMYSMQDGSGGKEVYDKLADTFQNQADMNVSLADAQYQSGMMRQAEVVKSITDQVRQERMQRLRAGMSESQIASQDMQLLLANTNALSEQADMANQARLQAQFAQKSAKDDAYTAYLDQMTQRGQSAAALYASDSGNPYWNTLKQMQAQYGSDPTKWKKSLYVKTNEGVTSGREPKE